MAPTLLGQPSRQDQHKSLYWEFQEKQALRWGEWKAVRFGGKGGRLELYNRKSDIAEKQDLSTRHPEIIAEVRKIMRTSHDAPKN